jgi:hypothetical protein
LLLKGCVEIFLCLCCQLKDGITALMGAAQRGRHECLSILLSHGAEVDKATAVSVRGVCSIAYLWDIARYRANA